MTNLKSTNYSKQFKAVYKKTAKRILLKKVSVPVSFADDAPSWVTYSHAMEDLFSKHANAVWCACLDFETEINIEL